jgi:hypothetical protein
VADLTPLFDSLDPPQGASSDAARFTAVPIEGCPNHRIGKDSDGAPALLLSVPSYGRLDWSAPIVLEHLSVQREVTCVVTSLDQVAESGAFTVLRCMRADRALRTYFLQVATALVGLLGPSPTHDDVTAAIERLVELFRSMDDISQRSVQGLWAELLLIARARDPVSLVSAWHAEPSDRYDFSAGGQRIEVKSATGRIRQHHFSLDQLLPPSTAQLLVASIFVERAGGGTAVGDLVRFVRDAMSSHPRLMLHVDEVVTQTLGDSWRRALGERFDRELAENSLTFYEASAIPKVDPGLQVGVSDVRFQADLTSVAPADLSRFRNQDGLFRAALRRQHA